MKLIPREHDIQTAILNYLGNKGIKAIRVNAGRYAVGEGKNRRMIMGAPTGTPDIIGVIPGGRALYVEVKRPGKKPRPSQVQVMDEYKYFGAVVCVATSVDELQETLRKEGV